MENAIDMSGFSFGEFCPSSAARIVRTFWRDSLGSARRAADARAAEACACLGLECQATDAAGRLGRWRAPTAADMDRWAWRDWRLVSA